MNPIVSLEGRTVVVTGAGQGIGKAVVETVVALGGNAVAVDLNGTALEAAVAALPAERVLAVSANVTDPARCQGLGFAANPDLQAGLVPFDLTRGGRLFRFTGSANVNQFAAFVQNSMTFGRFMINAGMRFDQYSGITSSNAAVLRLGGAYHLKETNTVLRAAFSRTFDAIYGRIVAAGLSRGAQVLVIVLLFQTPADAIYDGLRALVSGFTGRDPLQLHAEALAGAVVLPHLVRAGLRQRLRISARCRVHHRPPAKRGARFSRNAVTPSAKSGPRPAMP